MICILRTICSITQCPYFNMPRLKICFFRKYIIIIRFNIITISFIQILIYPKGKLSFFATSADSELLDIGVLVLVSFYLPVENFRFFESVFKSEEELFSCAVETWFILPCFKTESSKFISIYIFDEKNGCCTLFARFEKGN